MERPKPTIVTSDSPLAATINVTPDDFRPQRRKEDGEKTFARNVGGFE